ncbi:NAD(P)/FAD-dependent oxidoreductase [Myroides odoratimimus]|uniref:flavin monoamine oxidase family protein n=1 Tax=Myroides odoratimimus TaxID=76832 RepID=UPI00310175EC
MNTNKHIAIIGAGLSGLSLAYFLSKKNLSVTILEASSRLGGRIQTIQGNLQTPLELGATWFSDMHPHMLALIEELELKKYPQFSKGTSLFETKSFEPPQKFFVPESESPSYRLAGGTQNLINTLASKIDANSIKLNTKVIAIKQEEDYLLVQTENQQEITANKVIVCIPPQLVATQIKFTPELPDSITSLLPTVQTWMAGSIKFTLEYSSPFWREKGYSGMLYSHAGIITEMYDHTNFEENKFGFTGFLNGGASSYTAEVRKEYVLRQLGNLLGNEALNPVAYFDKVWTDEFILSENQIILRPHQNNGHPYLQQGYMNNSLFLCSTETSGEFPGYMEGAVYAAKSIADKI